VFVVFQQSRWEVNKKAPVRALYLKLNKVGRTYGYVVDAFDDRPFNLSDGKSHHKECNTRANGYGFDVYSSKEEYEQIIADAKDYAYLKKRLLGDSYYLVKLSPAKVKAIHAILDQKEEQ
jgi:hypothetical protein